MALLDSAFGNAAESAQDFAGAAGDLITAGGYRNSRDAYYKAGETSRANAGLEQQNLTSEEQQRRIQLATVRFQNMQDQRQAFMAQGSQKAAISAAGLESSGSALDVIRETARQGEINAQLGRGQESTIDIQGKIADTQGQININSYLSQATSYDAQGHSADAAASAATASAAGKTAAGGIKAGSSLIHFLTLGIF